jgi:hypothetical protein
MRVAVTATPVKPQQQQQEARKAPPDNTIQYRPHELSLREKFDTFQKDFCIHNTESTMGFKKHCWDA